uniref:EEF1A lysine methyltransferase 3 n=1 Tax=Poecilia mexicana TaxID=48701 RepID=A0A3B3WED8_9TELE
MAVSETSLCNLFKAVHTSWFSRVSGTLQVTGLGCCTATFSIKDLISFCGNDFNWPSSMSVDSELWRISCVVTDQSVELRGRRVIELGAGTGVVGILAARLGAEMTITDLPLALPQLRANVSANVPPAGWPSAPPAVLPLCWGEDHLAFPSDWDLVLCADIVYLPETYPLLVETLAHLCKNGAVVYLSSKMRREHRTQSFYKEHLQSRFDVELVLRDDKQNNNIYRASKRAEE